MELNVRQVGMLSDIALEKPAGEKIVDLAVHRAEMSKRFPKVDDIVDRLSSETRSFARVVGGLD